MGVRFDTLRCNMMGEVKKHFLEVGLKEYGLGINALFYSYDFRYFVNQSCFCVTSKENRDLKIYPISSSDTPSKAVFEIDYFDLTS